MKVLWALLLSGSLVLSAITSVVADELQLKQDYPERYIVQKGDTLWDISGRYLQNPWEWPEIWNYNQQIKDPHLIFPGDELTLVWVDGRPQLRVNRGKTASTIKLSPYVRKTPIDSAITTIPLEVIKSFLQSSRFVSKEEIEAAPYVLAAAEGRVMIGKNDRFFAKGDFSDSVKAYTVYREGDTYKHPRTKEKLGTKVTKIGEATVLQRDENTLTLYANAATSGFLRGDLLLPKEEGELQAFFQPKPVIEEIDATIMEVVGGVLNVGKLDVVMIDIGTSEGINEGSVFGVYKDGEAVKDPKHRGKVDLPDERAGNLMVFKAFDSISYALVMSAEMPLSVGDALGKP